MLIVSAGTAFSIEVSGLRYRCGVRDNCAADELALVEPPPHAAQPTSFCSSCIGSAKSLLNR